jgi:hypothetical protein
MKRVHDYGADFVSVLLAAAGDHIAIHRRSLYFFARDDFVLPRAVAGGGNPWPLR